jgi:RimJ/RimL family protein N-acetyltransferase
LSHFKLRALSPSCEGALGSLFGGMSLREAQILFYRFEKAQPNAVSAPMVDGIRFAPIDRAFLLDKNLENIEHIRAEIRWMWPSEARFYERGFGYAAVVGERAICWCTAEYVSAACCGVGIETEQAYERRGVATATAARFVEDCKRRALTAYWECRKRNIGSIRVAEKVGFEQIAEERYWVGALSMLQ